MKSAEYTTMLILLFIKNISIEYCNSIKEVIQLTDKLSKKFKFKPKVLPRPTKYCLVQQLVSSKILVAKRNGNTKKIKLAESVKNYVADEGRNIKHEYVDVANAEYDDIVIPKDLCGRTTFEKTTRKGAILKEVFLGSGHQEIKKYGDIYTVTIPTNMVEEHGLQNEQVVWLMSISFLTKHCKKTNQVKKNEG